MGTVEVGAEMGGKTRRRSGGGGTVEVMYGAAPVPVLLASPSTPDVGFVT